MFFKIIQFAFLAIILCVIIISCSLPRTVVRAPLKAKEEFIVGSYRVIARETIDSVEKFFKFRYYPVYHFAVVNSDSEVADRYVGGFQEYL
ncbi:MAG TPA: hypothetical protein VEC36_00530, partial [Patescibacteria group bacterium]|nr:hypothetical protein [Patescibacteria group bacterium]